MNKPQIQYSPVRKIRAGSTSLRGKTFSIKNDRHHDFESSLERDFLTVLEYDENILNYCEQPMHIEYQINGVTHHYTPDVLVYFRTDIEPAKKFKPTLFEVKFRKDLKNNWKELKPKFMAALRYADSKGWKFKIVTEKEIRTHYLDNVRFLNRYHEKRTDVDMSDLLLLLHLMDEINHTTPEELMLMASSNKYKQAEFLYTIWYMVANRYVQCDINRPLTIQSEIWVDLLAK